MVFVSLSICRSFLMVSRKVSHPEDIGICNAPNGITLPPGQQTVAKCRREQLQEFSKYLLSHESLFIFKRWSGLNSCAKLHLFNARSLRLPGPSSFSLIYTPLCSLYPLKCSNSTSFTTLLKHFINRPISLTSFVKVPFVLLAWAHLSDITLSGKAFKTPAKVEQCRFPFSQHF